MKREEYRSRCRVLALRLGTVAVLLGVASSLSSPALARNQNADKKTVVPAKKFDLRNWNITIPSDENGDQKPDTVSVKKLKKFSHPDFFYLDENDRMVFASPNKAATTKNSTNARSELRYMIRGKDTRIKTHAPENNFAVEARRGSDKFGSVGGRMDATLRVDHVSKNAGDPNKRAVYSVVVGQIHAIKYKSTKSGFGYGNEPLKIFYKKWPGHDTGSVFWTYERNLAKDDPKRTDIDYLVWGNDWGNIGDPGATGIALGEDFSYTVNVFKNTMHLIFENEKQGKRTFKINLANNIDANGDVDLDDNVYSYGGDSLYFKAGVYNQCSTAMNAKSGRPGCDGSGDWDTDKANGDYVQASFSKLIVSDPTPM